MVARLHDRVLDVFTPDLGRPVANSQEELVKRGVALDRIHRSVVLSAVEAEFLVDLDRAARSLVRLEHVALLGAD